MSDEGNSAADKQIRALARLQSLKAVLENPATQTPVLIGHAHDYHKALEHLQECGESVRDFRIPDNEMRTERGHPRTHFDRDLLLARVATVLAYFAIRAAIIERAGELQAKPAGLIGFEPPQRSSE